MTVVLVLLFLGAAAGGYHYKTSANNRNAALRAERGLQGKPIALQNIGMV